MIKVRKYNKKLQPFSKDKIIESIKAATERSKQDMPESKMAEVAEAIKNELILQEVQIVTTEDIANIVEKSLMSSYQDVAKCFITYRHDKQQEHVYNSDLIKTFKKKLNGIDIENANANSDERSFSGRMKEASNILLKDDALNTMSKLFKSHHVNNRIYVHDLDSYSSGQSNCLSIPFDNLLRNGVAIKQTDIRQPKSIHTAFQLIAVLMQVQSLQQFGGVSATHIDWSLVPYVRYSMIKNLANVISYENDDEPIAAFGPTQYLNDIISHDEDINFDEDEVSTKIKNKLLDISKVPYSALSKEACSQELFKILSDSSIDFVGMLNTISNNLTGNYSSKVKMSKQLKQAIRRTIKDTKQGAEGLLHNLNSLQSRSGQQLPFSSINYGTNTSFEGRMITDAILEAELDGTGPLHKTPIFPCCIFQYHSKINGLPGTPNYDLFRKALLSTTKRLYPNYCNVEWSIDKAGANKDVLHKREVLSKLSYSNMQKLVQWCKNNTNEALLYKMRVNEDTVVIDPTIINPVEIMSTMGKCKCSSSKIF